MTLAVTIHITINMIGLLSIDRYCYSNITSLDDSYCEVGTGFLHVTSTRSVVRSRRATARASARPSQQKTTFQYFNFILTANTREPG